MPRQEAVWVGPADPGRPKSFVAVAQRPAWVWTWLSRDMPSLPVTLLHHHNAFLEDNGHDWYWSNGVLEYYSRISNGNVWLVFEYDD